MRPTRFATLLLALTAAIPMLAGIGADVTIPAAGVVALPNDLNYRTELVITNHRVPGVGDRRGRARPHDTLVAYASTVDMQTGDAFSGIRVPSKTRYNRLDD